AANGASSLDAEVYAEFDVTADPSQPDDSVPAATDDNDYSFGRPVIDSVEPGAGPLAGGNTVVITGSGFENPDLTFSKVVFDPSSDESGDLSNAIDGVSATVFSDTEIAVTAPDATTAANGASSLDAEVYAEFDVTADPSQPDDSVPAATDDNDYSFASIPGAPTGVNATAAVDSADVSWNVPTSDGGQSILSYTVTATPGGQSVTVSGATMTATISGLLAGTDYVFDVTATNAVGTGDAATSNSVEPTDTSIVDPVTATGTNPEGMVTTPEVSSPAGENLTASAAGEGT